MNEILSFVATRMCLKNIMLNYLSQKERNKYCTGYELEWNKKIQMNVFVNRNKLIQK